MAESLNALTRLQGRDTAVLMSELGRQRPPEDKHANNMQDYACLSRWGGDLRCADILFQSSSHWVSMRHELDAVCLTRTTENRTPTHLASSQTGTQFTQGIEARHLVVGRGNPHLGVCEHVDGRGLEHHSPLSHLMGLPRHDVRQEVVYVLFNEP